VKEIFAMSPFSYIPTDVTQDVREFSTSRTTKMNIQAVKNEAIPSEVLRNQTQINNSEHRYPLIRNEKVGCSIHLSGTK
jgi:hypothetical protein